METTTTKATFLKYPVYKDSGEEWLGEIPEEWELKRFKYLFKEINERSEDGSGDLLSVSQYTGVTKKSDKVEDGDLLTTASTLEGYKKVYKNDLVSNIMLAWNGSLGFSPFDGITSPAYSVYRLIKDNSERFFHYLVRSQIYKAEFKRNSSGIIESRLRLYTDDFYNIRSLIPSPSEQTAIANFLDDKTTKIDLAISQKEKLIALLKERKQIIIQQAVTKGLDPNVKMKDSGVEWIGEIPEGWEVKKVKNLFQLIIDPAPNNNDMELLSIYTDIGVKPRKDLEQKGNRASTTDGYWKVKKGDFIVNKLLAWMGAIGLSDYEGVTSPAYDILRPRIELDGYFYHLLFRTKMCSSELKKHSRGIMEMRLRLYFDKFGVIYVPFPPFEEQNLIVNYIKAQFLKIDQAIALQQTQIKKLKEYKATLIDSAVTGKIKVC